MKSDYAGCVYIRFQLHRLHDRRQTYHAPDLKIKRFWPTDEYRKGATCAMSVCAEYGQSDTLISLFTRQGEGERERKRYGGHIKRKAKARKENENEKGKKRRK